MFLNHAVHLPNTEREGEGKHQRDIERTFQEKRLRLQNILGYPSPRDQYIADHKNHKSHKKTKRFFLRDEQVIKSKRRVHALSKDLISKGA